MSQTLQVIEPFWPFSVFVISRIHQGQGPKPFLHVSVLVWGVGLFVLVGAVTLAFALWPSGLARRFGGVTSFLARGWPTVPMAILFTTLGLGLAHLLASFFACVLAPQDWNWALLERMTGVFDGPPGKSALAGLTWLAPWLPVLLIVFSLLYLAARHFSPRYFHLSTALLFASLFAGAFKAIGGGTAFVDRIEVMVADIGAPTAIAVAALLTVVVVAAYRSFASLNASFEPRTMTVGVIKDHDGKRRADLERLLEEGFYKSAFHTPSPIPGGQPMYSKRLMELPGGDKFTSFLKSIGGVLHLTAVPHNLQVKGAVLRGPSEARQDEQGVRVQVTDSRTGELVLADTYWGKTDHEAVELASYAIVTASFFNCRYLPEWVVWRGRDGKPLRSYWRAMHLLKEQPGTPERKPLRSYWKSMHLIRKQPDTPEHQASGLFIAAARQSPTTAYPLFHRAELLELEGLHLLARARPNPASTAKGQNLLLEAVEIYAELLARYPHLLVSWFRLAAVLSNAESWVPADSNSRKQVLRRLRHALSAIRAPGSMDLQLGQWTQPAVDQSAMVQSSLKASASILRWMSRAINVDILRWCFSLPERRWVWMTMMRPWRERVALHRSIIAARLCVELQSFPSPDTASRACTAEVLHFLGIELASGRKLDWRTKRLALEKTPCSDMGKHKRHISKLSRRLRAIEGIERELAHISQSGGGWRGLAYYVIGCFYAQCLSLCRADADRAANDYWAERAVSALRLAARDTKGALTADRRSWINVDPDLKELQHHPRFTDWMRLYRTSPA